ncbi:MAG: hypothetical protein JNM84_11745 [Planctomycetes bacterium]|nr:hypothetical protein [Planctomycetota bacterium]
MTHPLRTSALAVLGLAALAAGQVAPTEVVVASKSDAAAGLYGGLVAVDPRAGTANPIWSMLPVIYEFEDVLVERGTGQLIVAGSATGPLQRQVQRWTLSGYGLVGASTIARFATDLVALTQDPFGDLWVLTTDPSQLAPNGELWRVDPQGASTPVLVESFAAADGTPVAICSDATRIFVATHRARGPALLPAYWEVSPLGGKREIPVISTAAGGEVRDLDLHRCGGALLIAFATGTNALLDLATRALRTHSTVPADRNRAVQYPTPVLLYAAGDGGATSRDPVFTWIERGVQRTIALPNFGRVTGLHADPSSALYHGAFEGPLPTSYACPGTSSATPRLDVASGTPDIGDASFALGVHVAFTPTSVVLLLGVQRASLNLQPLGFPAGCSLLVLPDLLLPSAANSSPHRIGMPIPCDPALLGALVHAQAFAADPAGGSAGWVASARGELRIG